MPTITIDVPDEYIWRPGDEIEHHGKTYEVIRVHKSDLVDRLNFGRCSRYHAEVHEVIENAVTSDVFGAEELEMDTEKEPLNSQGVQG